MRPFIVALEGLVHAGKTTLIRSISQKYRGITCVGEYVEYAGGCFPTPPKSLEEARQGRLYFLGLESLRVKAVSKRRGIVLLDRSFLSVLAYHFAIERVTGILAFQDSLSGIRSEGWIIPGGCLYLDISDHILYSRHKTEKGGCQAMLLNAIFNGYLREFYEEVIPLQFPSLKIHRIDGSQGQEAVKREALEVVKNMLK